MVTLEQRRKRGDLVQMYKVLSGKDDVNYTSLFELASSREGSASTKYASDALYVTRNEGRTELKKTSTQSWSVTHGLACQTMSKSSLQLTSLRMHWTT